METIRYNSEKTKQHEQQQNEKKQNKDLFNHLLKISDSSEVNNPISLGMEPVS